jgi:hypothetical protein
MLAINANWISPNFKKCRACIEFVKIHRAYIGENLSYIVFNTLKRIKILKKLIAITGDNATNNDTLSRHLYKKMSCIYNEHLDPILYIENI